MDNQRSAQKRTQAEVEAESSSCESQSKQNMMNVKLNKNLNFYPYIANQVTKTLTGQLADEHILADLGQC